MRSKNKSLEDILYALSAEPNQDEATVHRYLAEYPQHAEDLLDVLHEMQFTAALTSVETELAADTKAQEAWELFDNSKPASSASAVEAFSEKLRGQAIIALAKAMNVPRSIIVAIRDRLVSPASIPNPFVARLATATKSDKQSVLDYLALPPQLTVATQFKSDEKPEQQGQVTYEELIEKTEMDEDIRQALLEELRADGPQ